MTLTSQKLSYKCRFKELKNQGHFHTDIATLKDACVKSNQDLKIKIK